MSTYIGLSNKEFVLRNETTYFLRNYDEKLSKKNIGERTEISFSKNEKLSGENIEFLNKFGTKQNTYCNPERLETIMNIKCYYNSEFNQIIKNYMTNNICCYEAIKNSDPKYSIETINNTDDTIFDILKHVYFCILKKGSVTKNNIHRFTHAKIGMTTYSYSKINSINSEDDEKDIIQVKHLCDCSRTIYLKADKLVLKLKKRLELNQLTDVGFIFTK